MKYVYEKDYETKKGNTFHFKLPINSVAIGILFIACAVFIILDAVGVSLGFLNGIPAWTLVMTALCAIWLINDLIKLKISEIYFPIAFGFMFLEKHIAKWCDLDKDNIINNWLVFLCAVLLCIGTKALTPKRRWSSKINNFKFDSTHIEKNTRGASTVYIDCNDVEDIAYVKNELGACNVYFSNVETYEGNKTLNVTNELGAMNIHVPSAWKIKTSIKNELGTVNEPEDGSRGDLVLYIEGKNELGALKIVKI